MMAGLLLVGLWSGCGGDDSGDDDDGGDEPIEPKLSVLEGRIFTTGCAFSASCHGVLPTPTGFLNLEAPVFAKLVNQPSQIVEGATLVVPGDPESSLLYIAITRDNPAEGVRRMPRSSSPMQPAKVEAIRAWIAAGAPND